MLFESIFAMVQVLPRGMTPRGEHTAHGGPRGGGGLQTRAAAAGEPTMASWGTLPPRGRGSPGAPPTPHRRPTWAAPLALYQVAEDEDLEEDGVEREDVRGRAHALRVHRLRSTTPVQT